MTGDAGGQPVMSTRCISKHPKFGTACQRPAGHEGQCTDYDVQWDGQPVSEQPQWQVFDYGVHAGMQYWLVAERGDQPERGWLFRFETDAWRLQSRFSALEAELLDLRRRLAKREESASKGFAALAKEVADSREEVRDLKTRLAEAKEEHREEVQAYKSLQTIVSDYEQRLAAAEAERDSVLRDLTDVNRIELGLEELRATATLIEQIKAANERAGKAVAALKKLGSFGRYWRSAAMTRREMYDRQYRRLKALDAVAVMEQTRAKKEHERAETLAALITRTISVKASETSRGHAIIAHSLKGPIDSHWEDDECPICAALNAK